MLGACPVMTACPSLGVLLGEGREGRGAKDSGQR